MFYQLDCNRFFLINMTLSTGMYQLIEFLWLTEFHYVILTVLIRLNWFNKLDFINLFLQISLMHLISTWFDWQLWINLIWSTWLDYFDVIWSTCLGWVNFIKIIWSTRSDQLVLSNLIMPAWFHQFDSIN